MKIESLILFAIIILIFNSITGCIDSNEENDDSKNILFYYDIDIESKSGEFLIYLPVVIEENGGISKIMYNDSIRKGDPTYKLENSKYGNVLNITANDSCSIRFSMYKKLNFFPSINTSRHPYSLMDFNYWVNNETKNRYHLGNVMIYSQSNDSINIKLDLNIGDIHRQTQYYIELHNGWQEIEIWYEEIMP
ncbi:MAG: hypothetical protein KAJ51_05240 [Thermoplasmata archaeon]|nr:hypothetical protein [Thermoplasmata archaeon]